MKSFRDLFQNNEGYILRESTLEALEHLYSFQLTFGVPSRLIQHHEITLLTALKILDGLPKEVRSCLHIDLLLSGVFLHDIGKTIILDELEQEGITHEVVGRNLLIILGLPSVLSDFCISDTYDTMEKCISLLADTLWKGFRNYEIEDKLVNLISTKLAWEFWDTYTLLDSLFEALAMTCFQSYQEFTLLENADIQL